MQDEAPSWVKPLLIVAAVLSCAIGVVLVFIPGPAVLFFALTAAFLAAQSMWLARRLDGAEMAIRRFIESFKRMRRRHP